jgi:chemotaxis protein CheD
VTPGELVDHPLPHIAGSVLGEVPPVSLAEFHSIQRFIDPKLGAVTAKILPGEYYVTTADELVTTVLGSCVAACIWDPEAGIGGMNHFMIPNGGVATGGVGAEAARYGMFAMELLINAILKNGGERDRLLVKLAGGGNVLRSSILVGSENVRFALDYVQAEGLEMVGSHLEGRHARRVLFHPLTGHCRVLELPVVEEEPVQQREREYADAVAGTAGAGSVELF